MRTERFEVREIETAKGETRWQVVGYKPDGSRVRMRFSTAEEALGKRSELEVESLNLDTSFGLRRTRLTDAQLLEAEAAYGRLGGLSLRAVLECGLKHYQARLAPVTVSQATARFLEEKGSSKRRKRTLGEYRKEFTHLGDLG